MATDPSTDPAHTPNPAVPLLPSKRGANTASFLKTLFVGSMQPGEIVVFHHSNLFYWWPVWAFGLLMGVLTYVHGRHLAIVPTGTKLAYAKSGEAVTVPVTDAQKEEPEKLDGRAILVLPKGDDHVMRKGRDGKQHAFPPTMYISPYKGLGTTFLFIVLLVIAITNVHMRGLWSFYVLLVLVMLAIIFAVAGMWEGIFAGLGLMSIHLNMGAYFFLSLVLLVLWLVNFFFFDRQTYMIFGPGQVRMRLEIGGGETVYGTAGMVVQKQRSDLFRHWILGFVSGDLVIRPVGVAHPIEMPNVLNVARKVRQIETLMKETVIVAQAPQ